MSRSTEQSRSAYIHVPFCRHRCGYCNFTLVADRDDLVPAYLEALQQELRLLETPRPVDTLFFGGGTPTHLAPAQLKKLLHLARAWFPLDETGEFSVEANPEDLCDEKIAILEQHGVTRVSLGAQSLNASKLTVLERDHTDETVERAVEACKRRFHSVSVDLIFAVPHETPVDWLDDLKHCVELEPSHVSTYGLTYEQGTQFWNRRRAGELVEIDEETQRAMYLGAIDTLTVAGYEHYEVSNFARPGHRCRHNEVYWTGRSYYAAGPGAARYVDDRRETNHRSVSTYLKRMKAGESPVDVSETLEPQDVAREALVFGLRRIEGVELEEFATRFGFTVDQLAGQEVRRFVEAGFFEWTGNSLRLTREGLLVSDGLWSSILRC